MSSPHPASHGMADGAGGTAKVYAGTLEDGTTCECFVLDVAPGGAKIMTDAAIDIGDRFALALVPAHPTRQPCEVVWRRGNIFGVKFLP